MKICFLAPANNYHTQKWCEYFVSKGHCVEVISFTPGKIDGVNVHFLDSGAATNSSDFKKIKYLFKVNEVKKIIKEINPDIINAHYATSYGMVAALSNPGKFFLSIWGSDAYTFPQKSFIHKKYFKYILKKAKYILSTSNAMAEEIKKYTQKEIYITPFGVKMDLFNPNKKEFKNNNKFVIGTAKPLEEKYGIDYLINSISIINEKRPDIDIKVKIAGTGSLENEYKQLAIKKNIDIEWLGFISQENVAIQFANMNIAIFPSITDSESFGVATIEAEACGVPVIVSNIPGLLETTIPNKTSIVFPKKNSNELADAIIKLYDNPEKRKLMGIEGRKFVLENFEYDMCFKKVENLFNELSKEI